MLGMFRGTGTHLRGTGTHLRGTGTHLHLDCALLSEECPQLLTVLCCLRNVPNYWLCFAV